MITKELFGYAPCGCKVYQYRMSNSSRLSAVILNYGGIIKNLYLKDPDGRETDIIYGFDTMEGYIMPSGYQGALIGRVGNRIGGGRFSVDGKPLGEFLNIHFQGVPFSMLCLSLLDQISAVFFIVIFFILF